MQTLGQIVDLQPLGSALKQARTSAIVKSDFFEAVRLVVGASRDIKPHKVDGPITLHCLEGRALLRLPTKTLELTAGQWVYLDAGEPHSVSGIEESSFLLTILFPTGSTKPTSEAMPHGGIDAETKTVEGLESLLDEGLEGTFPASDPVAVSDPLDWHPHYSTARTKLTMRTGRRLRGRASEAEGDTPFGNLGGALTC